jgi:hypothetical protein
MGLSKKVRFEVFKRDRFTCQYCGKRPPDVVLEVDHVVPKCDGGKDIEANLTTACMGCNRGKAGVGLGAVAPAVNELEVLAAVQEMLERKQALLAGLKATDELRATEEAVLDSLQEWWRDEFGEPFCNALEAPSIRKFLSRGLGPDDFLAATTATAASRAARWPRSAWKYFCGVCWARIRERDGVVAS